MNILLTVVLLAQIHTAPPSGRAIQAEITRFDKHGKPYKVWVFKTLIVEKRGVSEVPKLWYSSLFDGYTVTTVAISGGEEYLEPPSCRVFAMENPKEAIYFTEQKRDSFTVRAIAGRTISWDCVGKVKNPEVAQ